MKTKTFYIAALIFATIFICFNSVAKEASKELNVKHIELGSPVPAIPFYHFIADLELPNPSIIEVHAEVNGKMLRATDLHRVKDDTELDYPPLTHRPPSGYGLSQDGTLYQNLHVTGWVKWQPGGNLFY